jgi:hypothetical protein
MNPTPASLAAPRFAGGPETARVLADLVHEHLVAGDRGGARRAAEDALRVVERMQDTRSVAEASLVLAEALALLHEAHLAKERFTSAIEAFDHARDARGAARARLGLARTMLALRDPAARPVLEDAGTLFEELGDEAAVLAIDRELRQADAELEDCPSSFRKPSTIPPPPLP